jgi:hypothetical protein
LAWKSGLKVLFLTLGRSCPLQTILLSDLVECDSPLHIVMAFWSIILSAEGCHTQPRKFEFKQKGRQTAITISRGLSHPTEWAALPSENISGRFFSRVEKPSNNINSRFFLMNKKGLKGLCHKTNS